MRVVRHVPAGAPGIIIGKFLTGARKRVTPGLRVMWFTSNFSPATGTKSAIAAAMSASDRDQARHIVFDVNQPNAVVRRLFFFPPFVRRIAIAVARAEIEHGRKIDTKRKHAVRAPCLDRKHDRVRFF
jgi:hypothetical protein